MLAPSLPARALRSGITTRERESQTNVVTLTWSSYDGGVNFNGAIPITGATGTYHVPVLSYYHAFSVFGRSGNLTVSLPYAVGTFSGDVFGTQKSVYRSGLTDLSFRLSVNLLGGPALSGQEFAGWKQKVLLGSKRESIRTHRPIQS